MDKLFDVADGEYTTPMGRTVVVKTFMIADSSVPQREISCGKTVGSGPGSARSGGRKDDNFWPMVPRCYPLMQKVFDYFMQDCDSLGTPVRVISEELRQRMRLMREKRDLSALTKESEKNGPEN